MSLTSMPAMGINGFGRIGTCLFRLCLARGIPVRALNASRTSEEVQYLLEHDTVHGKLNAKYEIADDVITVNGIPTRIFRERDPSQIPWRDAGVEYVIDATGKFLTFDLASQHFIEGARRVLLSAPPKGSGIPTFVMGVNHTSYDPSMHMVSAASCTTNCAAPILKVISEAFGIVSGNFYTTHAMTGKQVVIDGYNRSDVALGRSSQNIIPSSTGASKSIRQVLPELKKLVGVSRRVPVLDGSLLDLSLTLARPTSFDEVCRVILERSQTDMKGIIDYSTLPYSLVSSDVIGNLHTCVFDPLSSFMINSTTISLACFYDNEMAYSSKLLDLLLHIHNVGRGIPKAS